MMNSTTTSFHVKHLLMQISTSIFDQVYSLFLETQGAKLKNRTICSLNLFCGFLLLASSYTVTAQVYGSRDGCDNPIILQSGIVSAHQTVTSYTHVYVDNIGRQIGSEPRGGFRVMKIVPSNPSVPNRYTIHITDVTGLVSVDLYKGCNSNTDLTNKQNLNLYFATSTSNQYVTTIDYVPGEHYYLKVINRDVNFDSNGQPFWNPSGFKIQSSLIPPSQPSLTSVNIYSDYYQNPAAARAGSVVNIAVNGNVPLSNVRMTLNGRNMAVDAFNVGRYTLDGSEGEGPLRFTIDYNSLNGNIAGQQVTTTTNGSQVVADFTPPLVTLKQNQTFNVYYNGADYVGPSIVDSASDPGGGNVDIIVLKPHLLAGISCDDASAKISRYGIDLTGLDDYTVMSSLSNVNVSQLTFASWIKPTGLRNGANVIIDKEGEYKLAIWHDGTLRYSVANTNPGWGWQNTGIHIPVNSWSHMAWRYDNGKISVFMNAAEVYTFNGSGVIGDVNPSSNDLVIGAAGSNILENIQAKFDNMFLSKRALPDSEIDKQRLIGILAYEYSILTLTGENATNSQITNHGQTFDIYNHVYSVRTSDIPAVLNTPGTHTYVQVTDQAGNTTIGYEKIIVLDQLSPIITLNGNSSMTVNLNDPFNDPGAVANDNCELDSNGLQINNTVNTSQVGSYDVTYTATDIYGNTASEIRNVNVTDSFEISNINISSNTANSAFAKAGDMITLAFTLDRTPPSLSTTIAGNVAQLSNNGMNYQATYTLTGGETDGNANFTIVLQDNSGTSVGPFTQTSDGSQVTIKNSPPRVDAAAPTVSLDANGVAVVDKDILINQVDGTDRALTLDYNSTGFYITPAGTTNHFRYSGGVVQTGNSTNGELLNFISASSNTGSIKVGDLLYIRTIATRFNEPQGRNWWYSSYYNRIGFEQAIGFSHRLPNMTMQIFQDGRANGDAIDFSQPIYFKTTSNNGYISLNGTGLNVTSSSTSAKYMEVVAPNLLVHNNWGLQSFNLGSNTLDCSDITEAQRHSIMFNDNQILIGEHAALAKGAEPRTVEAWIYPENNDNATILDQGNGSGANSRFGLGRINGNLYFIGGNNDLASNAFLPLHTWSHIAVTYDGSNLILYLNGQEVARQHKVFATKGGFTVLGGRFTGGERFHGKLAEVRYWNVARTPTEILDKMNSILRVDENGLSVYYPFNEGTGSLTSDFKANSDILNVSTINTVSPWSSDLPSSLQISGNDPSFIGATMTDQAGNTKAIQLPVYVIESNPPVITLNGDPIIDIGFNVSYIEQGATVTDDCGIDSRGLIIGGDLVDTSVVGSYTITYDATDISGNSAVQQSRTINVLPPPPTAIAKNISINLDAAGSASITPQQINNGSVDFNSNTVTNLSLDRTDFTCTDVTAESTNSPNTAIQLDGADDSINTGIDADYDSGAMPQSTWEAWIKPAVVNNNMQAIMTIDHGSGNWQRGLVLFNGQITLWNGNANGAGYYNVQPFTTDWQHVAVTFDQSNDEAYVYVDGVEYGPYSTNYRIASSSNLLVGANANGNANRFNGTVDEVRVWDDIRTSTEIDYAKNRRLNGGEDNLVGYFRMEDGTGSTSAVNLVDNSAASFNNIDANTAWVAANDRPQSGVEVTLTATDSNNNTSTATALVQVNDDIAPTITCPADITENFNAVSTAGYAVTVPAPQTVDNCGSTVTVTNDFNNTADATGDYPEGSTVVNWTITDAAGNSSTCSMTVTVTVDAAPTAIAQDLTVILDANGSASITAAQVDNGSSDAEGPVTLNLDRMTFDCSDATGSSTEGIIDFNDAGSVSLGNVDNYTNAYTVSSWIKTTGGSQQKLFSKFHSGVYGHFLIWMQADGTVKASNSVAPFDNTVQPSSTTAINDGKWHHIAVTYGQQNGTGKIRVYVDGHLEGESIDQGINSNGGSVDFIIGSESNGSNRFTGQMDDILIWNTQRSSTEILEDMKGNVAGNPLRHYDGDTAVADELTDLTSNNGDVDLINNANVSVLGSGVPVLLTATDGNSSSAFAKAYITVQDTTAPIITLTGDATVNLNVGDTYTDAGASVADNCSLDSNGVVVDGSAVDPSTAGSYTVTYDATDVNGNTATQVTRTVNVNAPPIAIAQDLNVLLDSNGSATITAAQVDNGSSDAEDAGGPSLAIDQTTFSCSDVGRNSEGRNSLFFNNDQIVKGTNTHIVTGNGSRTIEAWVYPTANGNATILDQGAGTANNSRFGLGRINNNLYFIGAFNDLNTSQQIPLNTWSHIAATHDGTTLRLYFNGNQVASAAKTFASLGGNTVLGGRDHGGGERFVGKMAEVRYWNRALTQTEIQNQRDQILEGNENGLIAYYPFKEASGSTTVDATGNGSDLNIGIINTSNAWNSDIPSSLVFPYGIAVTLTATDSNGSSASALAYITIQDNIAPVINLIGAATVNLNVGDTYVDAGVTATDNCGIDTNGVVIGGQTVDTSTAGTYIVTYDATDMAGNAATQLYRTVTVVGPELSIDAVTHVNCHGESTGSITASITGGVAPFTYTLSDGTNTLNLADLSSPITGLAAGTYTLSVTDGNGATDQITQIIQQSSPLSVTIDVASAITCNGNGDGELTARGQGGTTPYTYSWNTGETNATETGLTAGTYSVTVTDDNGCTATASYTLTEPDQIGIPQVSTTDASSAGINDGSLNLDQPLIGGTAPYTYSWIMGTGTSFTTGTEVGTTADVTGVAAGNYRLNVTDSNGCFTQSAIVTIGFMPSLTSVTLTSNNANSAFAKAGDTALLSFTSSAAIQNVTATIAGQAATVSNVSGNDWTASYTFNGGEQESAIAFAINYEDTNGINGPEVTATTNGSSVTTDFTAPTLTSVGLSSPEFTGLTGTILPGDLVELTFTSSEDITDPEVWLDGSIANTAFNTIVGTSFYVNTTASSVNQPSPIVFEIRDFYDRAGNAGIMVDAVTDGSAITVDDPEPVLTVVSIASDNANPAFAKAGDTAILSFTADGTIQNVNVTIAGQPATVSNTSGNDWTGIYNFTGSEAEGVVPFSVDFENMSGSPATQVVATTDGSLLTTDFTAPVMVVNPTTKVLDANGQAELDVTDVVQSADGVTLTQSMDYGSVQLYARHPSSQNTLWYASGYAEMGASSELLTLEPINAIDNTVRADDHLYLRTVATRFGEPFGRGMMYRSYNNDVVWEMYNASRDNNMRLEISQDQVASGEPIDFGKPFYLKFVHHNRYLRFNSIRVNAIYGSPSADNELSIEVVNGVLDNNSYGLADVSLSLTSLDCSTAESTIQVSLTGTDEAGNQTVEQVLVTVDDATAPILSLIGADFMTVDAGTTFTDPGVQVQDNCNQAIVVLETYSLAGQPVPSVDTAVGGVYTVTYSADDGNGNSAQPLTREVYVDDGSVPAITSASISSTDAINGHLRAYRNVKLNFESNKPITVTQLTIGGQSVPLTNLSTLSPTTFEVTYMTDPNMNEGSLGFTIDYEDNLAQTGPTVTTTTDGSDLILDYTSPTVEITSAIVNSNSMFAEPGVDTVIMTLNFSEQVAEDFTIDTWSIDGISNHSVSSGSVVLVDPVNHVYEFQLAIPATTNYPSYSPKFGGWYSVSSFTDIAENAGSHYSSDEPCNNVVLGYTNPSGADMFVYENGSWTPNAPDDTSNPSGTSSTIMVKGGSAIVTSNLSAFNIIVLNGAQFSVTGRVSGLAHILLEGSADIDYVDYDFSNSSLCAAGSRLTAGTLDLRYSRDFKPHGEIYIRELLTSEPSGRWSNPAQLYLGDADLTLGSSDIGSAYFDYDNVEVAKFDNGEALPADQVDLMVEQYISAGRAYRFLGSTVNTTGTVYDNWQEGGDGNITGYGTQITGNGGAANGFDVSGSNNPSMFGYDNLTQSWTTQTSTNGVSDLLTAGTPYRLYVRGDRQNNLFADVDQNQSTVLRTTGTLLEATSISFDLYTQPGGFNMIANPFQAPYDLATVMTTVGSNGNPVDAPSVPGVFYYAWDATMGTVGSYVTYDVLLGQSSITGSDVNGVLAPGQAVFVLSGPSPSSSATDMKFTFRRNNIDLGVGNIGVFSTGQQKMLDINLRDADDNLLDGLKVMFQDGWNNGVDHFDAVKFANPDENLARMHGSGTQLSIERRAMPVDQDVLPLYLDNYRKSQYQLVVGPTGLDAMDAYLIDHFTGIQTLLNRSQQTTYSFNVNPGIVQSVDPARFEIVFSVTSLGEDDILIARSIQLYPNPVSDGTLTLSLPPTSLGKAEVLISDMAGRRVLEQMVDDAISVELDVSGLPVGAYMVQVNMEGQSHTTKLVVAK